MLPRALTAALLLAAPAHGGVAPAAPGAVVARVAPASDRTGFSAGVARHSFDDGIEDNGASSGSGRVLGVGVAFAAGDRVTLGLEALRHVFESTPEFDPDSDYETTVDTISLRASWRF